MLQHLKILLISDLGSGTAEIERTLSDATSGAFICALTDQDEALRRVEKREFDTVVCLSKAGALGATFFLNEVWKRNPATTRFVLDAFPDPGTIVRCLLGAHHFIEMPCTAKSVRAALERAQAVKQYLENERLRELLSRMRTLPTKPTVYLEVTRELRSSTPNPDHVAEVISKDLAISTKLLQVANSSFYGRSEPVSELRDAVLFLGFETIDSLVMSIEAFSRFDKIKPLYFTADKVWKHSQAMAEASKKICRISGKPPEVANQAYLSALLHDIGKLALAENFGDEYGELTKEADKQNRFVFELENEKLGATHADAGAYLLGLWGLPLPVVNAVHSHHTSFGSFNELNPASVVHFAEHLFASREPVEDIVQRYAPELGFRTAVDQIRLMAPLRMQGPVSGQEPKVSVTPSAPAPKAGSKLFSRLGRLWK